MTILGRVMGMFPTIAFLLILGHLVAFIITPSIEIAIALIYFIYGFPLTVFVIHKQFYPEIQGRYILNDAKKYCPWWGVHQMQVIYDYLPIFERILRIIPGAYSIWLRLWGSRVGRSVYWTPSIEIADRSLMRVGNAVVFGHRAFCSSHVISKKTERMVLLVKQIEIEDGVFLGTHCKLGPGAKIAMNSLVKAGTHLYPNAIISNENSSSADLELANS